MPRSRSSVAFGEKPMTKIITVTVAAAAAISLSACGATIEQKAASGAIAGAVVGGPASAPPWAVRLGQLSAKRKSRTKTASVDARSYRRACDQGCGTYLIEVLRPRRRDAPNDASGRFAGCEP